MVKNKCLKKQIESKRGVYKLPKGASSYEVIDKYKCYPVRGGNSLSSLRKWERWASKNYPSQKTIILDNLSNMQDKLSKMRRKSGLDNRYTIYGNY